MDAFINGLAMLSPLTGEQKSVLPWIIGGIGLVALIAFVVLSILQKKKQEGDPAPTEEMPAVSTEGAPLPETPVEEVPTQEEPPTNDDQDAQ